MKAFDVNAPSYDEEFSFTKIGVAQRQRVWSYLDDVFKNKKLSILELNGGTGIDAQKFSRLGHDILYTDNSFGMIDAAKAKCRDRTNIRFKMLDLKKVKGSNLGEEFDMIFSNFGGLNALSKSDLYDLSNFVNRHLKKNGSLIMVIMPKDTILDNWYRKIKKTDIIIKSDINPTNVNVSGQTFETYYHNYKEITGLFSQYKKLKIFPTGFFPSYFENWFDNKNVTWKIFKLIENLFCKIPIFSNYSDHYLIHLNRQN